MSYFLGRDPMAKARRRLALGLFIVATFVWGGDVAGRATAASRLEAFGGSAHYPVDVMVHLDFVPTPFHGDVIRDLGTYDGRRSSGNDLYLRNVTRHDLQRLSRLYWITSLEPVSRDATK